RWLMQGDLSRVHELDIAGVSQIHFEGGSILRTARANPTRSPEALQHVVESLRRLAGPHLPPPRGGATPLGAAPACAPPRWPGPSTAAWRESTSRKPLTTIFPSRRKFRPSASQRRWAWA